MLQSQVMNIGPLELEMNLGGPQCIINSRLLQTKLPHGLRASCLQTRHLLPARTGSPLAGPSSRELLCPRPAAESPSDDGALLDQLYLALQIFSGLEEIERALEIPELVSQSQAVDPEQFSSQESSIMLEQKAPVFPQQYASQAQMAQGS